ncbi:MAG TPA: hypothetical protein VK986_18245, partial [Tepidisphaeraceae bacterium]|nr:hypothetical protein [Tepidisphaeraceae bacterium]
SAAQDKLKADPADADANLAVGRFQAVSRGNWGLALPALARGADKTIKAAAVKDLANPTAVDAQVDVAGAWWAVGEKEPPASAARQAFRARAATWYTAAKPGAVGLTRAMIDKRLAEFAAPAGSVAGGTTNPPAGTPAAAKPGERPRPGRKYDGTVFVSGDDKFELCINGQPVAQSEGNKVVSRPVSLALGDVITARVSNQEYESGFMCAIRLDAGFVLITHHTTWASYRPRDEAKWADPAGITEAVPASVTHDRHLLGRFADAFQADQESLWTGDGKGKVAYLACKVTPECFLDAAHLEPPAARDGTPGALKGTLYANGDDSFILYVNGRRFADGREKLVERPITLLTGDVITVRCQNVQYERGFAAVIKLDNGKVIVTDPRTWAAYTPRDPLAWYLPAGMTNLQPAAAGQDNYLHKHFAESLPVHREPIWAPLANKSTPRVAFLALKVSPAVMTAPGVLKPRDK